MAEKFRLFWKKLVVVADYFKKDYSAVYSGVYPKNLSTIPEPIPEFILCILFMSNCIITSREIKKFQIYEVLDTQGYFLKDEHI